MANSEKDKKIINAADGGGSTKPTSSSTAYSLTPTEKPKREIPDNWFDSGSTPSATYDSGFKYTSFTHPNYQESDVVRQAKEALDAQLAQKPGAYQSQWQTQLNDVMDKIMNREKFSYDLNGDALYQQYKDKYIQQGKMASQDVMGQAAAMTGGYGNSYAASVGNQAYQASLQNLNDIVPELYQMAYDRYSQEGQDLLNQYGLISDRENTDYGRYRDTVSDFNTERDYLTGRYDSERSFDYSKYTDGRDFAYQKYADDKNYAYTDYRTTIADKQWKDEYDLAVDKFDYEKEQANKVVVSAPAVEDTTLTAKEYNEIMVAIPTYADMGEDALDNYLSGLVTRKYISADEAKNIYLQYVPSNKLPDPPKKGGGAVNAYNTLN